MSFLNGMRFPILSSFNQGGGPIFSTSVVEDAGGAELRDQTDEFGRGGFTVSFDVRIPSDFALVRNHFYNAHGKLHTFPYRDWSDYIVTVATGVLGPTLGSALTMYGTGTGFPTYQLYNSYSSPGVPDPFIFYRPIYKPSFDRTLIVTRNGTPVTEGVAAGNWEVNLSQGLVGFVSLSTTSISAITNASPGVVTASAHGRTNGQVVFIHNVGGMAELNDASNFFNGAVYTVANKTTNTFELMGVDTTDFGAFTSGGTVELYPQPGEPLRWAGQFDCICRYDTDIMNADLMIDRFGATDFFHGWKSIPLRIAKLE